MLFVKACRNIRHAREIAVQKQIIRAPDKVRYCQVIIPDKGFDSVRFGVRKNRGYLFVIAFIFVFHCFLHHNIDFFCFIAYNVYRLRNKRDWQQCR